MTEQDPHHWPEGYIPQDVPDPTNVRAWPIVPLCDRQIPAEGQE